MSLQLILGDDALGCKLRRCIDAAAAERVAGCKRVVYVAQSRSGRAVPDLPDAEACFEQLDEEIDELVVVSSTQVFEPSHRHLAMTPHVALPRVGTRNVVARDWRHLEELARTASEGRGLHLTLLRPAPVVVAGGGDFWSRLLRRRIAITLPGFDPTLQLLTVDDLARVLTTLRPPTQSVRILHLVPRSNVPLREALRHAGVLRLAVPRVMQACLRPVLRPLGAAPLHQIDYLRQSFTVADAGMSETATDLDSDRPRTTSSAAVDHARGRGTHAVARSFDDYGLDRGYVQRLSKTLFRFLHDVWWRVDVRGLEHLPRDGPAVLVGIHRGFQPWDGVMAMQHVAAETGRYVRFLTHPTLFKFPFLAPYMQKLGAVPAAAESADRILSNGEVLAVFPEGIRGAFIKYGPKVYRPARFQHDFVAFALRYGAPIVPFVTLGSAEIYPILWKLRWGWWRRWSEWPCLPVTPTLGTIPLPSKWHTRVLTPIHLDLPPEAARDTSTVRRLSAQVRQTMSDALTDLQRRRRHIFWGDLAPRDSMSPEALPRTDSRGTS
ncbi:MAG: 1-acyl-sn-glycerol-3-phosphate acyltransferase [Thermoanaerobaculia bacterium]|nr:1-acyl-sn-glycerol-3-phosphate acyltransferase [Thermoanaerobaculia bacterium]